MTEPTVQINLRLAQKELDAIDEARSSTVPRTWWIRGAVRERLGWHVGRHSLHAHRDKPLTSITDNPDLVNISITEEGTLVKTDPDLPASVNAKGPPTPEATRSPEPGIGTGHREGCKCLSCERARGHVS